MDADYLTVISPPENWGHMEGYAINDAGQVTGIVYDPDNIKYAFRYTPPTEQSAAEFITFALSERKSLYWRSVGLDINNSGQVAGYSYKGTQDYRPSLYSDDTGIEDLTGANGRAHAVNDVGDVTGYSSNRGFVYLDGLGTFNLDDMVVGDDADLAIWNAGTSIYPAAINDPLDVSTSGEISGYIWNGANVPFLLTPQPSQK